MCLNQWSFRIEIVDQIRTTDGRYTLEAGWDFLFVKIDANGLAEWNQTFGGINASW
ncbi:MAG: hypothetical protein ACXABI_06470 [Candidatus Hodarchaeales archaeon]